MLLYNSSVSGNCYKVRLLLAHLGLEHETVEMSVVDRSNRVEVLGALNPGLRIPTLVLDDGRPLAESNAILWYFGDGTQYVPEDPYQRAQVLQWQFFEENGPQRTAGQRPADPATHAERAPSGRSRVPRRRSRPAYSRVPRKRSTSSSVGGLAPTREH
jgi:glutathione S-transferase